MSGTFLTYVILTFVSKHTDVEQHPYFKVYLLRKVSTFENYHILILSDGFL